MDPREAAQYGNLPRLKELLDSGEITANWTDSDECSLLHWAAINNRLQVAELLIRHKCNVNAVGGVLRSTPLHWSARQGHVMMVALLVRNGAIVDKRDVEGFSALHCAAQSGATPVVAYLIAKGQPVDCLDEGRMTPAMWAAFKCTTADPLQILITLGADVNKSDSSYMNTPLHWATVAGNLTAMKTLIKANCDLTSVNRDNESALDIAVRKADVAAIRLLEKEARKRGLINATFLQKITERPKIARRVLFLFPFLVYFLIWCILRLNMPFAIKGAYLLLIALFCKYLPMRFSGSDVLEILPISFAIASKIVLILTWFFYLQQVSTWYMQIAFSFLIFILPFTFFTVSYSDPGYIVTNYQERCKTIIGVSEGIYPSSALCSTCILLRPVRSKHCRYCNKCVARMDHHCPWVNNCIALNNHRSFILYLMTVVFATLIFDFAILSFWFDIYGSLSWEILKSCDQWLLFTFIVSAVSAIWCFCMLVVQIYQILLEITTNERLNAHRYAHIQVGDNKFDIRSPYSKGFAQNLINFFCGDRQNEQSSSL